MHEAMFSSFRRLKESIFKMKMALWQRLKYGIGDEHIRCVMIALLIGGGE